MAQAQTATPDLMEQYNQVVDSHRVYLNQLQAAFDKECERIGNESKKKLETVPEEDVETRKQILMEQQQKLDKALADLKHVATQKSNEVRKKLEEIQNLRDQQTLNIEQELANL